MRHHAYLKNSHDENFVLIQVFQPHIDVVTKVTPGPPPPYSLDVELVIIPSSARSPLNLTRSLELCPFSLAGIFPMFVNCVLLFATPPTTPISPPSHLSLCLPCSSVLSNSH
ncbi:hypothetical protein AMECASPLE_036303 [Ameca splendens]|uniref:Uncharacterized protein n=1 Tax=Ameca splendens TaxID=208324 RepID=A0ABV0XKP1_9TELE